MIIDKKRFLDKQEISMVMILLISFCLKSNARDLFVKKSIGIL